MDRGARLQEEKSGTSSPRHSFRMMKELGMKSSAELVQFAIQQHVVSVEVGHLRSPGISDFAWSVRPSAETIRDGRAAKPKRGRL
jgi:hypothetical protein